MARRPDRERGEQRQPPSSVSFQRVEEPGPDQAERGGGGRPPVSPHGSAGAAPGPGREPRDQLAGRFTTAAAALLFAARLIEAGRGDGLSFRVSRDHHLWLVVAEVELSLARELAQTARGQLFVSVVPPAGSEGGRRFVHDRGSGPVPTFDTASETVELESYEETDLLELVRVAGLQPSSRQQLDEAVVLLPGFLVQQVNQRALDLQLRVGFRPVRLSPLFDGAAADPEGNGGTDSGAGNRTMIELSLSPPRSPAGTQLPPAFLAAVARHPHTVVCRRANAGGSLLVEHGMASPLGDHHLVEMVDQGTWVLAGGHFGCWRLEPAGERQDGWALTQVADTLPLVSNVPLPEHAEPGAIDVTVVPARTDGALVDGLLLDDVDLRNLALFLEGHPLADIALVVPGSVRHLLIAPGGVLERMPIGEPLYCLGPGPLYLPLNSRTRPLLPPSGRRRLFDANEHKAIVLTRDSRLVFQLDRRRPAWTLWCGDRPLVEDDLPSQSVRSLESLDPPSPAPDAPVEETKPEKPRWWERWTKPRERVEEEPKPRPWQEEAMEAELEGDLVQAAEIHRRNRSFLRAAHLYERAARELGDGTGMGTSARS